MAYRARAQIDRENAGNQLNEIEKVLLQLNKVEVLISSEVIRLGSLVQTNNGIFFIISVGSLLLYKTIYLGVAPNSPIGIQLLGKKKGDSFSFNNKNYEILNTE